MTPTDIRRAHTAFTAFLAELDEHIAKLELELQHAKNLREHTYAHAVALDAARPLPAIDGIPPSEDELVRSVAGKLAPRTTE